MQPQQLVMWAVSSLAMPILPHRFDIPAGKRMNTQGLQIRKLPDGATHGAIVSRTLIELYRQSFCHRCQKPIYFYIAIVPGGREDLTGNSIQILDELHPEEARSIDGDERHKYDLCPQHYRAWLDPNEEKHDGI